MADVTLPGMFFDRVAQNPDAEAFRHRPRAGAPFANVTRRAAKQRIDDIAAGLLGATEKPIPAGACASIISETRLEWVLVDYALQALGFTVTSVYATLLAPETGYIHVDSKVRIAVVENKAQLDKLRELRAGFTFFDVKYDGKQMPLEKIVVIDPAGIEPAADWESLAAVEERGQRERAKWNEERAARLAKLKREDVATYVYTSGTTGPPKGVTQTHENHLAVLENSKETGFFEGQVQEVGAFLFLPLAHAFGRLIEYGTAFYGATLVFSSIPTVLEDLTATRPGLFPAAPRVYEKIYSRVHQGLASASPVKKALFAFASQAGREVFRAKERHQSPSLSARVRHRLADKLVWSKVRARLGLDRAQFLLSGSAPLAKEVQEFFGAAGLTIYEGYGLTESTPALTLNRPHEFRCGTVGKALKGVTLRIAEDGEILAKGPNITSGYLNRPDANADAFDDDGWFHTGDIGEYDADGFLRITDRKKDLLKTSGGKYIAPQKIENQLKLHPLVYEAVVIGDNKNFVTALISVDKEALKGWADRTGNAADPYAASTLAELQKCIDAVNHGLARFESVKYFRVLDAEPTVENGMLTASFKVKRKAVVTRYQSLIDDMYRGEKELAA